MSGFIFLELLSGVRSSEHKDHESNTCPEEAVYETCQDTTPCTGARLLKLRHFFWK